MTMNAYADVRYCDIRATLKLIDITAQGDATPTASSAASIAQLDQTINDIDEQSLKLATCEKNLFVLDGSFKFLPDCIDELETGWWSESISDEAGIIKEQLIYSFSDDHSSYGFTIIFDDKTGEYASELMVTAYNSNDEVIANVDVINKDIICNVVVRAENYRKIIIEFKKTSKPGRRVRVTEVYFGIIERFKKDNTISLNINREFSYDSSSLPISEVDLTFDNTDQKYNMLSPNGVYEYLQIGMPLLIELGIGEKKDEIEYQKIGEFYFCKSNTADDNMSAQITAQDLFMFMDRVPFTVSMEPTTTLEAITLQISKEIGKDIPFDIEKGLSTIQLTNFKADKEISCRVALQQAVQALKAICFEDKTGRIVIKPLTVSNPKDVLDSDKFLVWPKIEIQGRINTMTLNNGEITSTYQDKEKNEIIQKESRTNSCVTSALVSSVAEWLLKCTRYYKYSVAGRGNPLRELAETVTIKDKFNVNRNAMIYKHVLKYDGGISEDIYCVGEEVKQ